MTTIERVVDEYFTYAKAVSQFGNHFSVETMGAFYFVKMATEMLARHPEAKTWAVDGQCHLHADLFASDELEKRDGRFGFPVWKDGKFQRAGGPHSWLRVIKTRHIIDVMPVAVYGGPRIYTLRKEYNLGQFLFHEGEADIIERIAEVRARDSYQQALVAIRKARKEVEEQIVREMEKRAG
ncbi:MAG: hypothetical protein PHV93_03890 [Candidatus Pacebacteria bacterium]|nr:hypothetical protein [Candidatus Paceibacterota bacterium]